MPASNHRNKRTKIISFSGIDGAGKSTHIQALIDHFRKLNMTVTVLTFWDDVVVWRRQRELASQKVFRGDEGIGSPEKPLNRRDKNVRSAPLTAIRLLLYLADAVHLHTVVGRARKNQSDLVIFDRYIYDELANLPMSHWFGKALVRALLQVSPHPDRAFIIDADPEAARSRKPEYPLSFLRENRQAYLSLNRLCPEITGVAPESFDTMAANVRKEVAQMFATTESDMAAIPVLQ